MENHFKQYYQVDKNSPVPMYFQIKEEIIKLIKSNIYKTDDKLPTEKEYCDALHISRPTIRQALQELINEGYIYRQKAKGTFVAKPKVEGFFFKKLSSYNDEMKQLGLSPSTNVLACEIEEAKEDVAEALQLTKDKRVLHLVRLRFANEEPMVYVHTYIPCQLFPKIQEYDFSYRDTSLYDIMKNDYHTPIAYVDRTIEAGLVSNDIASLLQISEKQAIYTIFTTAYNKKDIPVEYSIAKYRGDRCKFSIRLVQQ